MIMPSHPILELTELATCRDLDSDGDSCWGTDNSADDSSRDYGKSDTRKNEVLSSRKK